MVPFVAVLLGAAAAGGAVLAYKKFNEPKALNPNDPALGLAGPATPGLVTKLVKGKTYAILVMLDWTKIPGATPTTPDKDAMAKYLTTIFGGGPGSVTPDGLGFKVLSTPALRSNDDASAFFAGHPSAWVLNAQWLKDADSVTMTPDLNAVLPMAAFYLLPVS